MKATAAKQTVSLAHAAARNYVLECTASGEAINRQLVGLYLATDNWAHVQRFISEALDSRGKGVTYRNVAPKKGLLAAEARLRELAVVFGVDDCDEE